MNILLKGGKVLINNSFETMDLSIGDERVFAVAPTIEEKLSKKVIHCDNFFIVPGFVDVHVHLREPGFSYKETIETGTAAGVKGGYTTVFSMPNLNPPPVDLKSLKVQLDIIDKKSHIKVIPFGAITSDQSGVGTLSAMEEMAPYVAGFSDDGKGVQTGALMKDAMVMAKSLGKLIVAHCEDETYDTYDPRSEWKQVERDLDLVKKTGCKYHLCHMSTKESVDLIRQAKGEGMEVTCETAPHYLVFTADQIPDQGRFKMNPPIRSKEDQESLIEGIVDGTIDVIATDHAPHSLEEKQGNFAQSMFGIVGLETAFPVMYTYMVKRGIITFEKLIDLMSIRPRQIFSLDGGLIQTGQVADLTVLNLDHNFTVNPMEFATKGRSTPFEGLNLEGQVVMTIVNGEIK